MKRLINGLMWTIFCVVMYAAAGVSAAAPADQSVNTRAPSAVFLVNATNDTYDGTCNASHCSLREAIVLAGLTTAHDTIRFDFDSVTFINVQSSLPAIAQPVTIDAITGTGASCPNVLDAADLRITLTGIVAGANAVGLRFTAGGSNSEVFGLTVINFDSSGIELDGASDVHLHCNHIGIAVNGTTAAGNGHGILISGNGTDNVIGGTTSTTRSQRNVISGNDLYGIYIFNDGNNRALITGNYIGTDALGINAVPNDDAGIITYGDETIIGGSNSYEANVISGNTGHGIWIIGNSRDGVVDGNLIGTNAVGVGGLGNTAAGISIQSVASNPQRVEIGLNRPNIITSNTSHGIVIFGDIAPTQITARFNQIYDNGILGIDLNNDGVSANDTTDIDGGANSTQNYPDVISAEASGRITGSFIRGVYMDDYLIDVYTNTSCDDSTSPSHGEGQTYHDTFTIPGGSAAPVSFDNVVAPLPLGKFVSLTATYLGTGNTSEFSLCIPVTPSQLIVNTTAPGNDLMPGDGYCQTSSGNCSLEAAIHEANGQGSIGEPHEISFAVAGYFYISNSLEVGVPVLLDGTSFAGTTCSDSAATRALPIIVSGRDMSGGAILKLNAGSDGSEVRGIQLVDSPDDGLQIRSNNNVIACNRIGDDPTAAAPNGIADDGIQVISGDNNRIGVDSTSNDLNVIVASVGSGIQMDGSAENNLIRGNFIGAELAYLTPNPNARGIHILASAVNNDIGGTSSDHGNRIGGNTFDGILITGSANNNFVGSNLIGPFMPNGRDGIRVDDPDNIEIGGSSAHGGAVGENIIMSNGGNGVHLIDSTGSTIGGNTLSENTDSGVRLIRSKDTTVERNSVASNSGSGIYLSDDVSNTLIAGNTLGGFGSDGNTFDGVHINANVSGTRVEQNQIVGNLRNGIRVDNTSMNNTFSQNAISENGRLGIDLGEDDLTLNDAAADSDSGANGKQNFPDIESVNAANGTIEGSLNSIPEKEFTLQFFANTACDSFSDTDGKGYGEGQTFIGETDVIASADGKASFSVTLLGSFDEGDEITATATGVDGTSEFSACVEAPMTVVTAIALQQQGSVVRPFTQLFIVFALFTAISGLVVRFGRKSPAKN